MDKVKLHFDKVSKDYDYYKQKNKFYYDNLKQLLGVLIPDNANVLEVGCGTGDLLASRSPKKGYGMDLSSQMVKIAQKKHNNLKFSTKYPNEKFDYIFMTDVIEHMTNPQKEFNRIAKLMNRNTIFINTMANPIWEPLLMFWEKMDWKMPEGPHNRIGYKDIKLIVNRVGMKIIKHDYKLLFPIKIPIITDFVNRYLERYLKKYAFIEYFVAKRK